MDRWGASSDKENASKTKSGDSKSKPNQPLKQQQILQKNESDNSLKGSSDNNNKSYKSTSSNGSHKSSKRQSGPVTAILGDIEADLESIANLPPPPMDNIVAEDEEMNEVSTIAGDTYSGVEMDASVAEAVPPYNNINDESYVMPVPPGAAQFDDAMITPTYSVLRQDKKRLSRVFHVPLDDDYDYDEEKTTLTENPTGEDDYGFQDDSALEQVEQGKSQKKVVDKSFSNDEYEDDEFDDEKQFQESEEPKSPPRRTRRFRCMMCAGFALAFLLLVGIAALGYTLYAIRNEDEGALSLFTKEFWDNAGDKMAFWKKDEIMDGSATIPPTSYTSWVGSSSGTSEPTEWMPTEVPITEEMETVMAMITALTFQKDWLNASALTDPSSMQYQVMEWLSEDPALDNYSQEQVMQRYALGCFYRGVLGDDIPLEEDVADAKNHEDIRETWMTYADECENWKNTETKKNQKGPCNDLGQIRSIHLENAALTGTLAAELSLLSDSLGK